MFTTTLATNPLPYSEFCDTFRPRRASAQRADPGGEILVNLLIACPMRNRLVSQHSTEVGPTGVKNRFGHVGLDKPSRAHVAHNDVPVSFGAGVLIDMKAQPAEWGRFTQCPVCGHELSDKLKAAIGAFSRFYRETEESKAIIQFRVKAP